MPRGWAQQAPVKTMSRIDVPRTEQVPAGTVAVAGVAWAVHRGISTVEVQVDDGPWQAARLGAVPERRQLGAVGARLGRARRATTCSRCGRPTAPAQLQPEEPADPAPDGAQGWHARRFRVTTG